MATRSRDRHLNARVVALLWRLPPELWSEPRQLPLPPAMHEQLDRMEPALLRSLLVELVYRLESQHNAPTD